MDIVDKLVGLVRPLFGDFGCILIGMAVLVVVAVVMIINEIRG